MQRTLLGKLTSIALLIGCTTLLLTHYKQITTTHLNIGLTIFIIQIITWYYLFAFENDKGDEST